MHFMHEQMISDRATKVRNIAEVGRDIVEHFYVRQQAGEFDVPTAQHLAKEALRELRYDEVDYFFIYDNDGNCIMQATNAAREGKNFIDAKDPNGVPFIANLIAAAKNNGAPVFYQFPRAGSDKPVDKIATTVAFKAWNWNVGTGIYIDDVKAEFWDAALHIGLIISPIVLLILIAGGFLSRNISRSVTGLGKVADSLAQEKYNIDIPDQKRGDEIGTLSRALQVLRNNASEAADLRRNQEVLKRQAEEEKKQSVRNLADTLESEVRSIVTRVAAAATEMRSTSESLLSVSENSTSRAATVTSAAEEAARNVQTVAAATEELSSSIQEISRQVTRSTDMSLNAVEQTR